MSLVPDASMSGVELSGFYQTPNHMAMKAIRAKLTSADWCVWSYLQMIDPYGDRFVDIPNHKKIAEIVGLSEKSVKRSVYKLEELGFYDTEVLAMKGKNLAGNALRANKKTDRVVQKRTKLSSQRQSCPNEALESLLCRYCKSYYPLNIQEEIKDTTETEGSALKIFERYEEKLKLYGINKNIWKDGAIAPNPKMKSILDAIALISKETAEHNIKAFIYRVGK
ncbi:hypothetical protein OGM63_29395 [Plectonema radiosum NIES-515]|uniref:Helix-turn-helix domain-containing protein n=1 Tax=Plectonema radiosum NIES-515 TaxID=2986073 RepID=A0ABT3B876_9CYAN|nr:hypothetical protein [Plectonema radiosum]MCV3217577.1 hypothetical protein [Plectonema radiosum NIES-515]